MIDQLKAMKWAIIVLLVIVIGLWFFPDAIKGALTGAASAIKVGATSLF